jgi:predicted  nucleic acid-binding Zn-ribbon protein
MSPSANVQSVQALADLKAALARFSGEAREVLLAVEQEIRRTFDWLQERLNHWQNEVRRRQEEVRQALEALARCQASGYTDRDGHYHAPDCSAYERALRQAQARLQEAEAELANVRRWAAQVQQAAATCQAQARRLQEETTSLGQAIGDLENYLSAAPPSGAQAVSADARLLERMERRPVDLSRGTEWGKFAHGAYEESLEQALPGAAHSEVRVRVRKSDGSVGAGRIDSLVGETIVDYKTHDLDKLYARGGLESELNKIAAQIQAYSESPDAPPGASTIVIFEFPPTDPECRRQIEDYFRDHLITVLWDAG